MANITQLPNITTATNTTTFVVINNSSTKRVSYLTIKNQLSNEIGKISALTDVNVSGLTDNQVLKYSTSTHTWNPVTMVTATSALSGLTDVSVGSRANGDILTYNTSQSKWVASPRSFGSLNDLSDVIISGTPFDGEVLKYSITQGAWVPGTDNTGAGSYTLTTATSSALGGVKIGSGISITPSGTISASGYSRTTAAGTTTAIPNNSTNNISITGFKSYALLKIQTSAAAWVRLYTTSAARSSDSARAQTTDPTPGSGVIAEVITSGAQTQLITPGVFGFNDDGTPSTTIYAAVTNLSGGYTAITVTLTLLQLES